MVNDCATDIQGQSLNTVLDYKQRLLPVTSHLKLRRVLVEWLLNPFAAIVLHITHLHLIGVRLAKVVTKSDKNDLRKINAEGILVLVTVLEKYQLLKSLVDIEAVLTQTALTTEMISCRCGSLEEVLLLLVLFNFRFRYRGIDVFHYSSSVILILMYFTSDSYLSGFSL